MAAEQLFSNILLGSRGGAVSGGDTLRRCVWAACAAASQQASAESHKGESVVFCLLQNQGSLKVTPAGLVWKRSGGGRTVEVPADGGCHCCSCWLVVRAHWCRQGWDVRHSMCLSNIWKLFKPV